MTNHGNLPCLHVTQSVTPQLVYLWSCVKVIETWYAPVYQYSRKQTVQLLTHCPLHLVRDLHILWVCVYSLGRAPMLSLSLPMDTRNQTIIFEPWVIYTRNVKLQNLSVTRPHQILSLPIVLYTIRLYTGKSDVAFVFRSRIASLFSCNRIPTRKLISECMIALPYLSCLVMMCSHGNYLLRCELPR